MGPENDLRRAVCVWFAQHVMFMEATHDIALAEIVALSLVLRDCEPKIDGSSRLCPPRFLLIPWHEVGSTRSELGADIAASGCMMCSS